MLYVFLQWKYIRYQWEICEHWKLIEYKKDNLLNDQRIANDFKTDMSLHNRTPPQSPRAPKIQQQSWDDCGTPPISLYEPDAQNRPRPPSRNQFEPRSPKSPRLVKLVYKYFSFFISSFEASSKLKFCWKGVSFFLNRF